jgi:HD-GYP domain-containing protein (c-di-GMP phosphodiesterase class II)
LTISNIFAALIEHRRYKPTMPRERAYEIIQAAFREVALSR